MSDVRGQKSDIRYWILDVSRDKKSISANIQHRYTSFNYCLLPFTYCLLSIAYCLLPVACLYAAQLKVYYIFVGQGDAQYIELPNGENVLIDGGPNSSNSTTNPLIYFLERKNVKKIDHIVLSHAHADHYAGLSAVFDRYVVKNYYDSFITGSSSAELFRAKARTEPGIKIIETLSVPDGTTFYWCVTSTPPVKAILLHRGDAFSLPPKSANDTSLVFKVVFGSSTFIFGGDAGAGGSYKPLEGWLTRYGSFLQSDCYKVNHHGSSSSSYSEFLSVLKPKYAFIGTDGNRFGHPTIEAMDRINDWTTQAADKFVQEIKGKSYTNIYATYLNGHIEVVTTGDGKYNITPNYNFMPDTVDGGGGEDGGDGRRIVSYVNVENNLFYPDKEFENLKVIYFLNKRGESTFSVYNIAGDLVYKERVQSSDAFNQWIWNGKNSAGEVVAPGAYFVFVETPEGRTVKKAVVMR